MRPTRDETWLAVAADIARRSTCLRRAVGCVLVDARGHVVATGYNGRAAGQPHCNEEDEVSVGHTVYPYECKGVASPSGTNLDGCEAIHAEQNALLQCCDVYAVDTCYVTASPCVTCVKLLMNTGCRRIVFRERYAHDDAARTMWEASRGALRPHDETGGDYDVAKTWDHQPTKKGEQR